MKLLLLLKYERKDIGINYLSNFKFKSTKCPNCNIEFVKNYNKVYCSHICKVHYNLQIFIKKFWSKVDKNTDNGCWLWKGRLNDKGYGTMCSNYFMNGEQRSHRISYILIKGFIPEGKFLLHSCHNAICVNPDHLRPGTQKENMQDMDKANRRNPTIGSKNPQAKLKEHDIIDILDMFKNGISKKELSAIYNIKIQAINSIIGRRRWKHVEWPVKKKEDNEQKPDKL